MSVRSRLTDIVAALRCVPGFGGWGRATLELAWALPLMLIVGHFGGLVRFEAPRDSSTLVALGATLFVAPALGEELLFRGLLIPRERPDAWWMFLSVLLFVLWHPLQALTIGPPWSAAFLDSWFLAIAAILGIALARIYRATQSLWPAVAAHWLTVFGWKAFLGGPL